jgi:hypothetical protein
MFHAELDINNIVVAVSDLISDESSQQHMVLINSFDTSLLGKKYDPTTNTFANVPLTLDQVKTNKKAELEQAYQNSFTTFQSSALGTAKTYPINREARDNFERYERRMSSDPNLDIFSFYTLEARNLVDHTRAQFIQLLRDAQTFEVQQHKHYNDKKNQVDDATDEATVQAIVW